MAGKVSDKSGAIEIYADYSTPFTADMHQVPKS